MDPKYVPINLTFYSYDYKEWFRKEDLKSVKTLKGDGKAELADLSPCYHGQERRKSKKRNRNQNLNPKQSINHTFSIISTNRSWK